MPGVNRGEAGFLAQMQRFRRDEAMIGRTEADRRHATPGERCFIVPSPAHRTVARATRSDELLQSDR
jgi:hypothetical protein